MDDEDSVVDFTEIQFDITRRERNLKEGLLYFNPVWNIRTVCRLLIKTTPDKIIVVITELLNSPGISITRLIEKLATHIHNSFLKIMPPEDIIWIEQYRAWMIPLIKSRERFSIVTCRYKYVDRQHTYSQPARKKISKAEVEALLGL